MSSEEQVEVERKYDAPLDATVPDLAVLPEVTAVAGPVAVEQVATYYDTADLRLLQARITLRRREGGLDDGWHLKLPGEGDSRVEVTAPLGADDEPVPTVLLDRVHVHVRAGGVAPRAVLTTRRTLHRMCGAGGEVLAEVCDDRVRAQVLGPEGRTAGADDVEQWREWEVELVAGSPDLLDRVEPLLAGAGALPAGAASKAGRVLGRHVGPGWRDRAALPDDPSVGDLLASYLAQQLDHLQHHDVMLRGGEQVGVHQVRVASRRMRSALATYRPALDRSVSDPLREELKWLGQVLGDARDAQVQRGRLASLVAEQPVELVLGPVAARIADELRSDFDAARARADVELVGQRYHRLLDRLEAFVADPPLTGLAAEPAAGRLPRLLAKDLRRVQGHHREVEAATDEETREHLLHEVRKAAKRLRYAAESAAPVLGARSSDLAERAEAIQELLGEHQDTVVSRGVLRDLGVRAHLAGENGFTFGRLHGLEEARAAELVRRYDEVYAALPARRLTRWLAG